MPIVAEEIRADFILNRFHDMSWQWHGNHQNHLLAFVIEINLSKQIFLYDAFVQLLLNSLALEMDI